MGVDGSGGYNQTTLGGVVACMYQLVILGQQPCNKPPSRHKMTCVGGEFTDKEVPVHCAYNGTYIIPYNGLPGGPASISEADGYTTWYAFLFFSFLPFVI